MVKDLTKFVFMACLKFKTVVVVANNQQAHQFDSQKSG